MGCTLVAYDTHAGPLELQAAYSSEVMCVRRKGVAHADTRASVSGGGRRATSDERRTRSDERRTCNCTTCQNVQTLLLNKGLCTLLYNSGGAEPSSACPPARAAEQLAPCISVMSSTASYVIQDAPSTWGHHSISQNTQRMRHKQGRRHNIACGPHTLSAQNPLTHGGPLCAHRLLVTGAAAQPGVRAQRAAGLEAVQDPNTDP